MPPHDPHDSSFLWMIGAMRTTTWRDPIPPAHVDLTRLPRDAGLHRFHRLTTSERRAVIAYLNFRLEADLPAHTRAALGGAAAGIMAFALALVAVLINPAGQGIPLVDLVLVVVTIAALTPLAIAVVFGPLIDRRRAFTRAWLQSLEKLPRESETMPT